MPALIVTSGTAIGQRIEVTVETVLGRTDIELLQGDDQVSRRHAVVRVMPGGLVIEDAGSVNGTFVNDTRVAGRASLSHGDMVRIGLTVFRVEDERTAGPAERPTTQAAQMTGPPPTAPAAAVPPAPPAPAPPTPAPPAAPPPAAAPAAPAPAAPGQAAGGRPPTLNNAFVSLWVAGGVNALFGLISVIGLAGSGGGPTSIDPFTGQLVGGGGASGAAIAIGVLGLLAALVGAAVQVMAALRIAKNDLSFLRNAFIATAALAGVIFFEMIISIAVSGGVDALGLIVTILALAANGAAAYMTFQARKALGV